MYRIVGRYMSGVKVLGYYLIDTELGTGKSVTKSDTEKLALSKQIINCTAQRYQGKILLKGVNIKLNTLPVVDVSKTQKLSAETPIKKPEKPGYAILARILEQKHVVGYVLIDEKHEKRHISRDKTIELASKGLVHNARVQMYHATPVLRGVGCDLSSLPGIRATRSKGE